MPNLGPREVSVEFRVLGPLEVVRAGVSIDLGPPKQRAVLGALVVAAGRTVSVDQLIDVVWGDDPPRRALLGIQAYVSKLRSLFQGAGFEQVRLLRRAPGYALETSAVDLIEFRDQVARATTAVQTAHWADAYAAASRAVGLWRGPLLADFMDEAWVVQEAAPVEELFAQCREALATALLGQSRVAEAVARSRALVEAYPLREQAWRLLIVALYRAGRSPEALQAYQQFVTDLDEQLGLEPGPDFTQLQTAILRHDPTVAAWPGRHEASSLHVAPALVPAPDGLPAWTGAAATTEADEPAELTRDTAQTDALVGRQAQLRVIATAIDALVAGGRPWLVLTGPAGIGKTRLADDASASARRRGVLVVSTACPDDEGTPAWWTLRPLAAGLGADPDVVFAPPTGVDADTVRFTVYQRLATLLAEQAKRQPVLVVIDDAQWLDAASTRLLAFLIRSRGLPRTGLLLTVREEGGSSAVPPVVAALGREGSAVHIAVPPLDGQSASELLNRTAGENLPASEAFSLVQRTGGNPLLLIEWARLPAAERRSGTIPLAARGLMERRLRHLPEQVLQVLRAAAVAGEAFELDLVAKVLDLTMIDVIDRLDAAAAEKIIEPAQSGHGYQFLHSLQREELLLQLSVMRRQALHARIADVLATRGTNDPRALTQRAQHLSAALAIVDPAVVEEACTAAARDAEDRWDWDAAARQWDAALAAARLRPDTSSAQRDALLLARLTALAQAGRGQTVLDVVDTALEAAAASGATATVGRLAASLLRTSGAWPWPSYGADPSAVTARLADVAAVVQDDPAARAAVLAASAVGNCYAPDTALPDQQSRVALQIAEDLNDPDVLADALVGRALAFVGVVSRVDDNVTTLDRLHGLSQRHAVADDVRRDNILTMTRFIQGDITGVTDHLRRGIEGSDRLRLPVTRVQLRWVEAALAQWHGQLDQAEELVKTAHQRHLQTELYGAEPTYITARLLLSWERGRLSEEKSRISRSAEPLVWGALEAGEAGNRQVGQELLSRRFDPNEPEYWYTLAYLTLMAHAAADLSDAGIARQLLPRLTPNTWAVAVLGQGGSIGPVALATSRLRALLGDPAAAREDLTRAEGLATAGDGRTALLRIRLARLELEPPSSERRRALHLLRHDAITLGMGGVARAAGRAAAIP